MSKEKFDKKLIKLLESNPDFVDEAGALHRAKVRDSAWKLNHDLIKLLLTDKEIEAKFFTEIEGVGFSTIIPSLTISPIKTSLPTLTPNSAIRLD